MKNLVLIGMMGCGKSTCGRALATALGRKFVDTDREIVRQAGMPISEIFATKGEAHFRQLETEVAKKLKNRKNLVIATGGGMILAEENRQCLRENGVIIFLNRDPSAIFDTADMGGRPLGQDGKASFLERFATREPIYRQTAHVEITNFNSVRHTATEILKKTEGML
ncbi:MAG: shikimate kinase [Eubacteriales bacterium]